MPDLKPCPFCGGEAEIERFGDRRRSTIYCCTMCGCSLETGEEWGHGANWNRRVDATPCDTNPVVSQKSPSVSDKPDPTGKCGELVTVGTTGVMPGSNGGFTQAVFKAVYVPEGAALCLRSQAEELLAAERAEKEERQYDITVLCSVISDLKADNADKDARIKELERGAYQEAYNAGYHARIIDTDRQGVIADLEAKLAAATDLLRQSRKSLKRAPFNLLVGIDDCLAGTEARAALEAKP